MKDLASVAQQKNVDRNVMTLYDGLRTVRVVEYPEPAPGNNKIYQLGTLAENGFPQINLVSNVQAGFIEFLDKFPYDNVYNDNGSPFSSAEASQSLYAVQSVMKAFDVRFGWKGLDGIGVAPVYFIMGDTQKYPLISAGIGAYITQGTIDNFVFVKDVNGPKPFSNSVESVAHEFTHAILRYKRGMTGYNPDPCSESNGIEEGVADVFGVYIRNRVRQILPQNFDWEFSEWQNANAYMSDPKAYLFPDTYNGENYKNECHAGFNPHPNAGVIHKWSYLLSNGFQGSAYNDLGYAYSNLTGIGTEKWISILWETLPQLKAYSDYPAFKAMTLTSAEQLYGLNSTEYLAVRNAWCAVGVCDNNLPYFSVSPTNGSSFVDPWPTTKVHLTWQNNNLIEEWEAQMDTSLNFTNPQTVKLTNFSTVIGPNQNLVQTATATGYYRPGTKVYFRAKISKAGPNFCKGLNPLCALYQKFGPTHVFWLDDQQVQFWPAATSTTVKAWKGKLTWKSMSDAERYRLQVSDDPSFNTLIYDGIAPHTGNYMETGEIGTDLTIGQTYYARVRAERLDLLKLKNNHGKWSNSLTIKAVVPTTAVTQAKTQKLNDPPFQVGTLGRQVNWDPVAGATNFVVQVATDNAFSNIVWSTTVPGNLASTTMLFPPMANLTDLFVQVLPKNGQTSGSCSNTWRIKINETAALAVMKQPLNGTSIPFKGFAGNVFEWGSGTLNMNTVDHFELRLTKKPSNQASNLATNGKTLNLFVQDPLIFSDKSVRATVVAVNSLGAKTGESQPFDFPVCADHPAVFFPGDLGKVDPTKDFKIEWFRSESFAAGSQYLVTINDGAVAIPGFKDKPTTSHSMLVPAGTLINGKSYTVTVRNSSSCPALFLPKTFFNAVGSGGANQPQPPKMVNFNINLSAFRNDPDAASFPPAFGTSNYVLGIQMIDPDGNVLALVDPNGNQVTQLDVDSENSGVIMVGDNKPQGKYKLRLTMQNIFDPLLYYPFDQPRFSVSLNGVPVVTNHVITVDFANPASSFNEWQVGFQFADIILDIK
ncbi:hypothetical protein GCM10010967_14880 [Dyadobacter beijingensis]|uniref:Peptidase M4 C-terminal domain-containing protein n=1 Tax=Dyadobacter beijingensis TaxID=365489 RepID=A0ABQ2HLT6_9BACT|nr:hypothetical protein GCM10010967_14880 [Dyadobacter beijingensis]